MLLFNQCPITTVRDFYTYFDIKQALMQLDEVLDFAEKNLLCMNPSSVNLYCCHALRCVQSKKMIATTKVDPESFWTLGGGLTVPPEMRPSLDNLYAYFYGKRKNDGWFSEYIQTAALLLLGKQDINKYAACLSAQPTVHTDKVPKAPEMNVGKSGLSAQPTVHTEKVPKAPEMNVGKSGLSDAAVKGKDSYQSGKVQKTEIQRISEASQIRLGYRAITGRLHSFYYCPQRKIGAKERIRTVELYAMDEVSITFIPDPANSGVQITKKVSAENSLFVNAVGCDIVSVLENEVSFEGIKLCREKDGIFAIENGVKLGDTPRLPSTVSSFAVLGKEAYLYVEQGELKYTPNVTSVDDAWYSWADRFVEVANDGEGIAVILDDRGRVFSYSVESNEKTTSLLRLLK